MVIVAAVGRGRASNESSRPSVVRARAGLRGGSAAAFMGSGRMLGGCDV
jgi:hypothetical protein